MNNIYFILLTLLIGIYIFSEVRKKKFSIKESFYWMLAVILMLILSIWPYSIDFIAQLFGIYYPPSLLFVFCILFLLFINFKNCKEISELKTKLTDLEQNMTIIKGKDESRKK